MTSKKSGTKHDDHKPDLSLLPLSALEQEAFALMFGAKKYGRYNYMNGFESHRLIAACLRHVYQWQQGQDLDEESGLSHLAHARACLGMLIETLEIGTSKDTRYTADNYEKPEFRDLLWKEND